MPSVHLRVANMQQGVGLRITNAMRNVRMREATVIISQCAAYSGI